MELVAAIRESATSDSGPWLRWNLSGDVRMCGGRGVPGSMDGNLDDFGGFTSIIFLCCVVGRRIRNKRGDVFVVVIRIVIVMGVNGVSTW